MLHVFVTLSQSMGDSYVGPGLEWSFSNPAPEITQGNRPRRQFQYNNVHVFVFLVSVGYVGHYDIYAESTAPARTKKPCLEKHNSIIRKYHILNNDIAHN